MEKVEIVVGKSYKLNKTSVVVVSLEGDRKGEVYVRDTDDNSKIEYAVPATWLSRVVPMSASIVQSSPISRQEAYNHWCMSQMGV